MDLSKAQAVAVTRGVASVPNLAALLGCPVVSTGSRATRSVVLAWGRKPSAAKAEAYAAGRELPVLRVEDGFLRSVELGDKDPPLSLVLDDLGIYYDATTPSRLEELIKQPLTQEQTDRAVRLAEQWRAGRVSKYCHARERQVSLSRPYVLAVDQTAGDASISFGLAREQSFHRMLEAALDENPDCTVVLKIHPDVVAGRKASHFSIESLKKNSRVHLLSEDAHPVPLIEHARKIYVVTSQMGFEGLLWNKPVRTFGMPFYAGWGLTHDEVTAPDRRTSATLQSLAHAALVEYPRYLDPETGTRCEPERLIEWMTLQRRMRERFPATVYAAGFSPWKQPIIREYLQGSSVQFVGNLRDAPIGATAAVWGREPEDAPMDRDYLHLEDGFIRSVGLGADLIHPLSWVTDRQGIYYDPSRPSDLEQLLAETEFDTELLERAEKLREAIVRNRITKYNLEASPWKHPQGNRKVVLVPGQVESDASILAGTTEIRTNLQLLQEVRKENPEAYLVYKPHPDVVAKLRLAGKGEEEAAAYCDEILPDADIDNLLAEVDEVHVLTSLAGFEALLRGKKVACHGMPFYAGWSLTRDRTRHPRRKRTLTLNELIAGALVLYPAYVSRKTGRFTTPERALQELLDWRAAEPGHPPFWRKMLRWLLSFRAN